MSVPMSSHIVLITEMSVNMSDPMKVSKGKYESK